MNLRTVLGATLALGFAASSASAAIIITEGYGGVSGSDGTEDWNEITNTSGESVSTAGWFYDDESADTDDMVALSNMTIGAGESVIFIISGEADADQATFNAFWGTTGVQVGYADGSGLKEGDTANLWNSQDGWFASLTLNEEEAWATTQANGDLSTASTGVSVDLAGDTALFGDPGSYAVPAPGALALIGLAGMVGRRRRR